MFDNKALIYFVIILCNIFDYTCTFNISPKPNIVLKSPYSKDKSNLFGYSINLRKKSILVGAPKDNSSYSITKIQESGAIYKCLLKNGECSRYEFDTIGDEKINVSNFDPKKPKSITFETMKDYQMFGMTMDGGDTESDPFVACAPRFIQHFKRISYCLHGMCKWVNETDSENPENVKDLVPFRKYDQNLKYEGTSFGQAGFSVFLTEGKEKEVVLGAPTAWTYEGIAFPFNEAAKIPVPDTSLILNSHFGYKVSAGTFYARKNHKTPQKLYAASSPSYGSKSVVTLFKFFDNGTVQRMVQYEGEQTGEYFGYTFLAEDFNNNNKTDVAVSAPFYTNDKKHEHGCVYVFMDGSKKFSTQLRSSYDFDAHFGKTLSKIGDINQDGFNDIAISAPLEKNGVVYIYLGGEKGLSDKPYQILVPPQNISPKPMRGLFGFAVSRGVDIDNNGYKDIAVSALNWDTVYVYKTYPIVTIKNVIILEKSTLAIEDTKLSMTVCTISKEKSNSPTNEFELSRKINLDSKKGRASFNKDTLVNTKKDTIKFSKTDSKCPKFEIHLNSSRENIFHPIIIEVEWEFLKKVDLGSEKFCTNCVLESRESEHKTKLEVPYVTGCKESKCISDLIIKGDFNVKPPYQIGKSENVKLTYTITNKGETAYSPQLTVTIPTKGVKVIPPSFCTQTTDNPITVSCDNLNVLYIETNKKVSVEFVLGLSLVEGNELVMYGNVSDKSSDSNPENNLVENILKLERLSKVDIFSTSTKVTTISENKHLLSFHYQMKNNGPTNLQESRITISIPQLYKFNENLTAVLLDESDIEINCPYLEQSYKINFSNSTNNKKSSKGSSETRGSLEIVQTFIKNFRSNVTTYMNCTGQSKTGCIEGFFDLEDFNVDSGVIDIELTVKLDFEGISSMGQNMLSFTPNISIQRSGYLGKTSVVATTKLSSAIVYLTGSIPWQIIAFTAIVGILILLVIFLIMLKLGLFKRKKKEIIDDYNRKSLYMTPEQLEDYTRNIMKIEKLRKKRIQKDMELEKIDEEGEKKTQKNQKDTEMENIDEGDE